MKKLIYLSLVISLLYNCTSDRNEGKETTKEVINKIDLSNKNEAKLSDLIDDVELIPLQTTEQSVLDFLGKIIYTKDKIFCLDTRSKSVFIFDSDGKFIENLENSGKGPGEYLSLQDFNLDKKNKKLELLSPRGKVISYNLESRKFETTISLPPEILSVHFFANLSEDIVLFYSLFHDEQLIFYSRSQNKVVKTLLPNVNIDKKIKSFPRRSPFYISDNTLYFMDPYAYTIYKVDRKKMELNKFRTFDFGSFNLAYEDLTSSDFNYYSEYLVENKIAFPLVGFVEHGNSIVLNYSQSIKDIFTVICYDSAGECLHVPIPANIGFYPLFSFEEDYVIGVLTRPEQLKEIFQADPNIVGSQYAKQIDIINEGDNPVLIKYKLNF